MFRKALAAGLTLAVVLPAGGVLAYEGAIHQQLTFIAARQYNRCVEVEDVLFGTVEAAPRTLARLTPLQVRYVAKANANQAEQAWWQRLLRWNYYDRGDQSAGRVLWLLETRIHNRYRDILRRLHEARDLGRRFTNLGQAVNLIQDATTPSHVVPVFTTRWWRFSVSDRFNSYPLNIDALGLALGEDCASVRGADGSFEQLLVNTADLTLASIVEPIRGLPSSWEAFWELDSDVDDFGRYGGAGNNFGRQTTFPCTEDENRNCVLLDNDPIYAEYAQARHLDAVRATISAMAMMQQRVNGTVAAWLPERPPPAQPRPSDALDRDVVEPILVEAAGDRQRR